MPHTNNATIHLSIPREQYPKLQALSSTLDMSNQAVFRLMLEFWADVDRDTEIDLALRYVQATLLCDWSGVPFPLRPKMQDQSKLKTLIFGALRDETVPF